VTLPPRPGPSPIRPRDGQTDHETNSVSESDGGASGCRWRWGRYRRVGPQISVDGDGGTHGSEVRGFCLLGDSSLVRLEVGGWRRGHHLGRERRVVAGGAIGPRRDTWWPTLGVTCDPSRVAIRSKSEEERLRGKTKVCANNCSSSSWDTNQKRVILTDVKGGNNDGTKQTYIVCGQGQHETYNSSDDWNSIDIYIGTRLAPAHLRG
jgi:hypothetical protein